jgi:hypothetical protein
MQGYINATDHHAGFNSKLLTVEKILFPILKEDDSHPSVPTVSSSI